MISLASPIPPERTPPSSPPPDAPSLTRARRFAILPPPPSPRPESPSPPVPTRSPLRPTPRSSVETPPNDAAFSKRKHALIELLSSERAYASDLALIRDIHIPLALGLPAPFLTPNSPASLSSPPSPALGPPMTKEDTKIIFGNVEELAVFSEVFCEKLEEALHGVLDPNGNGQDRVGELFLSMIPHLKPPYTTYITRHPSAVAHLNALPQTPALTAYLAQTHTLAQSYTHAWDLPSLLIKPVQRLLKYPLLLSAIIEDTEPGESRDRLREACEKVQEVARGVNEGRRRLEVVKGLLEGKHPPPTRIKSIKSFRQRSGSKDGEDLLERLEKRLHSCETFVHEFAKDIVEWTMSLRDAIAQLERWSTTFGRVIGLGQAHGSEALELFTDIVASQITPVWISLDAAIQSTLLPKLARLLATTTQPLLLLSHMHALRPQHLQLLDAPLSKARPPASLLEASQSYLALEAQLRTELPRYLALLERGFSACLGQFADWQSRFWKEVRSQWVELWDALGVEGDMTAGAVETVKVWWDRWEEIDAIVAKFGITKPKDDKASRTSLQSHGAGSQGSTAPAFAASSTSAPSIGPSSPPPPPMSPPPHPSTHHRHSLQSIDFDIDMYTYGFASITGSPEVNSPASYDVSMSAHQNQARPSAAVYDTNGTSLSRHENGWVKGESESRLRKESDRSIAASPENDRPSVVRQGSDKPLTAGDRPFAVRREFDRPSTARREGERPATVRTQNERPATAQAELERPGALRRDNGNNGKTTGGVLKKPSADSANLMFTHSYSAPPTQPSPRLSVNTSESSASGSSNRRHSLQSMELGSDNQFGPRPGSARTSGASITAQAGLRPYGAPPPSMSEFGSRSVLPRAFPSTTSLSPEADGRGRVKKPGMRKRLTDAFRSPSKRPSTRSSGSIPEAPRSEAMDFLPPEKAIYTCAVVHPFVFPGRALPPYRGFPFLTLRVGDIVEVLVEAGHPRLHEALPIRPEDEDCQDCLLMARDERGALGWAMASFLVLLP